MPLEPSPRAREIHARLQDFMDRHVYPVERQYQRAAAARRGTEAAWEADPLMEALRDRARDQGLWNLFLARSGSHSSGLTNLEYAPMAELMGRVSFAAEVFNCAPPDSGNMEILAQFGTPEQKARWLEPMLRGDLRSSFLMSEPEVASSDAANVQCRIERRGNGYVVDGRKWWASGAGDPRCQLLLVIGRSNPAAARHEQLSMIAIPRDAKGVTAVRPLGTFGYDDAPSGHMEVVLDDVHVPADHVVLGEGRGFEIAQKRLGPGRVHHCMRAIGMAERALEMLCSRLGTRVAFGKPLAEQSIWHERIAEARCSIDQARMLAHHTARLMDTAGNKAARAEIAMVKIVVPAMACRILDWAIQAHGAAGLSDDFPLAAAYAHLRVLRIADGPDEVHMQYLARLELARRSARPGDVEMPLARGF